MVKSSDIPDYTNMIQQFQTDLASHTQHSVTVLLETDMKWWQHPQTPWSIVFSADGRRIQRWLCHHYLESGRNAPSDQDQALLNTRPGQYSGQLHDQLRSTWTPPLQPPPQPTLTAQWERVLMVGGQENEYFINYFTVWKNLVLSQNTQKIHEKYHDKSQFASNNQPLPRFYLPKR